MPLPIALLIALIAFFVAPWAEQQASEYQQRFAQREDISQVSAGRFRESASANRVFFVESLSDDQSTVRNVFVTQSQGDNLTIVVSTGGRIQNEANGDRFLVLEEGRRYDGLSGRPDYKLMEFERYGLRLEPKAQRVDDDSAKIKTTIELLVNPDSRNLAELLWRISLPVSALLMALLAIPLSAFNPRVGRSVNLMVALLVYVVYNNLVSLMQGWVAQEKISFEVGVVVVHLGILVLIALMFYRRLTLFRAGRGAGGSCRRRMKTCWAATCGARSPVRCCLC